MRPTLKFAIAGLCALNAHATSVTYDFNSNNFAATVSDATASASDLTLQISTGANTTPRAQQLAERSDGVGATVYYINNRSFATSETTMSANETAAVFTITPASGRSLDFSAGTFSVDVSVFVDQGNNTNHVALYTTTGGSTSQIGSTLSVSNNTPASDASLDMYDLGTTNTVSGWSLDPTTTSVVTQTLSFNLTSLGELTTDEAVTFTITGLVDGINTARFNSAFDNYTVNFDTTGGSYTAATAVIDAYAVKTNQALNIAASGLIDNDLNPAAAFLSAIKVSDPTNGSVTINSDGSFIYTPNTDFTGNDSFEYKVYDGTGDSNTTTVHLVVAEESDAGLPNILIYFADDMGYGDTQVYNPNCPVNMPNLERLAEQGMRFTDAHTPQALCAPNRYSLLTGNYWDRSNKAWNLSKGKSSIKIESQESIAVMLNKAGYHTAMFGKGHIGGSMPAANGATSPTPSVHPNAVAGEAIEYDWTQRLTQGAYDIGFDYSFVAYGGLQDAPFLFTENDYLYDPAYPGNPEDNLAAKAAKIEHLTGGSYDLGNGTSTIEGNDQGDGMYYWASVDVGATCTTKAIEFIDGHHQDNITNGTSTPFFIYYAAEAVHVPHTPPIDFLGTPIAGTTQVPTTKNTWTGYSTHSDMLYEIDVSFGMILDSLEETGLLDNTIVIFTSDNGGLKDSVTGTNFSNTPLSGYKSTAAEGGHRVPFIVRWGDGTAAGSHISPNTVADQMVNIMDIYTTLAEIVGVEVPSGQALDSVSMRGILLEGSTTETRTEMLGYGGGAYYVRDSNWKFTESGDYAGLYNLATDLDESDDLSSDLDLTQRLSDMQTRLTGLKSDASGSTRTTTTPATPPAAELLADEDGDGMEDSWERRFFGSTQGLNGNASDDIDKDLLPNLIEYALGGNPTDPSDAPSILPDFQHSTTDVDFSYTRRNDASLWGLTYTVESTDDLSQPWDNNQFTETSALDQGNGLNSVTERFNGASTDQLFMRLNIEKTL